MEANAEVSVSLEMTWVIPTSTGDDEEVDAAVLLGLSGEDSTTLGETCRKSSSVAEASCVARSSISAVEIRNK